MVISSEDFRQLRLSKARVVRIMVNSRVPIMIYSKTLSEFFLKVSRFIQYSDLDASLLMGI